MDEYASIRGMKQEYHDPRAGLVAHENHEIPRAVEVLEKQLAELAAMVTCLCERVDPICRPPTPTKATGNLASNSNNPSPFANMIGGLGVRVMDIRSRVTDTLDRLDL